MKLRGAIPVMAASYHEDERLDEDGLRRQVDFAIAKGAAAVCTPGFGTEFYKLSDPERYRAAFTSTMLSVFLLNSANRKIICEKLTSKDAETNSALLFETVSGMTESPTLNLSQTAATV